MKCILLACIAVLAIILPVHAHQASYAMFDFEETEDGIVLVVATQPETVLDVVLGKAETEDPLGTIAEKGEMLAAYIERHVWISQDGEACEWTPSMDPIPPTPLDADAEGITVRAHVSCEEPHEPFTLRTDLYVEQMAHQNIVRYRKGDQFYTFAALDRKTQETTVDLREVFTDSIRETEEALRHARRVNTAIGLLMIAGIIAIMYWFRKKVSK